MAYKDDRQMAQKADKTHVDSNITTLVRKIDSQASGLTSDKSERIGYAKVRFND